MKLCNKKNLQSIPKGKLFICYLSVASISMNVISFQKSVKCYKKQKDWTYEMVDLTKWFKKDNYNDDVDEVLHKDLV